MIFLQIQPIILLFQILYSTWTSLFFSRLIISCMFYSVLSGISFTKSLNILSSININELYPSNLTLPLLTNTQSFLKLSPINDPQFIRVNPRFNSIFTEYEGDSITTINRNFTTGEIDSDWVQGDILPPSKAQISKPKRVARGGICLTGCNKWPRIGQHYSVPYRLDSSYAEKTLEMIQWVMQYIASGSNIRFVPHTIEGYYLLIKNQVGCASFVGRRVTSGPQLLNLKEPGCIRRGTILHELTHALGVDHEHQRPDRNSYIHVFTENVNPADLNQIVLEPNLDSGQVTLYDFASIMHYERKAFSKNGLSVLQPIDNNYNTMLDLRRSLYSTCDWNELYYLYPGPIKPPACIPHVAGRGLEPTEKCLINFSRDECELACIFASDTFLSNGYAQPLSGFYLPPLPTQLPILFTGVDIDPTGDIYKKIVEMEKFARAKPLKIYWILMLTSYYIFCMQTM